jgi:hypothetical protein
MQNSRYKFNKTRNGCKGKKLQTPKPTNQKRTQTKAQYLNVRSTGREEDPGQYTKNPHEYGDLLIVGGKLGGTIQRDLIYWIQRHTWGDARRPEYAKLSLSQLAKLCGGVEKKNVSIALADLFDRQIITIKDRTGCGNTVAKMYKLTPEHWKEARKYTPPSPAALAKAQAVAEAEDNAEEAENTKAATSCPTAAPIQVRRGKPSQPQPVQIQLRDSDSPVKLSIVYHNECPDALTFSSRTGKNGRLEVFAAPHCSPRNSPAPNTENPSNYSRTRLQQNPENSGQPQHNKEFKQYLSFCQSFVISRFRKPLDPELFTRIMNAAGNAPLEMFAQIVNDTFRAPGARKHTSGLLVALATRAAQAHAVEIEAQNHATPFDKATEPAQIDPNACLQCGGDPKIDLRKFGMGIVDCEECKGTGIRKRPE